MKENFKNLNVTARQVFDILLLAILVVFIVQNLVTTEVKFLFFKFSMPLIVIIILVFLIGALTSRAFFQKQEPAEKPKDDFTGEA